jgi:hypothetical protein
MTDKEILKEGFVPNNWYDKGRQIFKGFQKGNLLVEKTKDKNLRIDGTDVVIKNISHLRICDKAFNYRYRA